MAIVTNRFKSQLKAYCLKRLGGFEYRHGWIKLDCPMCGKPLKFGINISLNRTNCFVCGYKEKPINLVMELEGLRTLSETKAFLNKPDFDGYTYKEEKVELKSQKDLYLPDGFRLLTQGDSQLAKSARAYVKRRGFNVSELSSKGWGYCNKDKYFGYLIIPFYFEGKLIYFNARAFLSNGPRYNNPDTDITGIGKSMIIYNKDALYMYKSVFLCEGAINAETMGDKAVSFGGKYVSRYQINDIIKSPVEKLIILLDPDALDKALDLALKVIDYKKVKLVKLPEGNDVNDLGKSKVLSIIYKTRYQTRQDLLKIKNSI